MKTDPDNPGTDSARWLTGQVNTPMGPVSQVATTWSAADRWGRTRVRLNIGRMQYTVPPGLYAVGNPDAQSPVLVSANYKLSFDHLRRSLAGLDGWVLVLDTRGINVWCAAGKGTFGTAELVERIRLTGLAQIVSHRAVIVPQLGATGVSAHQVRRESGFTVVYGPVRCTDIKAFLDAGMKATPEMRQVRFDLPDRLAVIPVELVIWGRHMLVLLFLLAGIGLFVRPGSGAVLSLGGAAVGGTLALSGYLAGGVLCPILLPWLPGRAFALKGLWAGGLTGAVVAAVLWPRIGGYPLEILACLMLPAVVASFMGMNFTGTSTFTSLSGVKREMAVSIPLQIVGAILGVACWLLATRG